MCCVCAQKKQIKGCNAVASLCARAPTQGSGAGAAVRATNTVRGNKAIVGVLHKNAGQRRRRCVCVAVCVKALLLCTQDSVLPCVLRSKYGEAEQLSLCVQENT